ncbi:50S ribosomal protein L19 [Patescibacteria group bacterium]|nr:50S ribosomal protein L19 [Patescibacteria group bacterium]
MNNARLQELYEQKGYKKLDIKPGQYLEIHEKLGDRVWRFKGLVIKVQKPSHPDGTFTIRGVAAGQTIEKVYPLAFQGFSKVTLLDEYKVRRAKLYYIREKVGKDAKFKSLLSADNKDKNLLA